MVYGFTGFRVEGCRGSQTSGLGIKGLGCSCSVASIVTAGGQVCCHMLAFDCSWCSYLESKARLFGYLVFQEKPKTTYVLPRALGDHVNCNPSTSLRMASWEPCGILVYQAHAGMFVATIVRADEVP